MRRIALVTTIVLLVLTILVIVWRLQAVVGILLIALVIAMTTEKPISIMTGRGAPRWLAVATVYGATVLGILAIAVAMVQLLASEIDPMLQDGLRQYSLMQARIEQIATDRSVLLIQRLPTTEEMAAMLVESTDTEFEGGLLARTGLLLGSVTEFALALVLAVYWSMDSTRFERLWLSLLPPSYRKSVRSFLARLEDRLGAYVRSELGQTFLSGIILIGLYAMIGIHYPFWLGVVAAVLWLIPYIGGVLAIVLAGIVGWFVSPVTAILAAVLTTVVLGVMEYIVQPRLFGSRQNVWGILTVILMLMLGDAFGLFGLVIAPPVALALQMLIDRLLDETPGQAAENASVSIIDLRAQVDKLKTRTEANQLPVALSDLTARLDELVNAANDQMNGNGTAPRQAEKVNP